MKKNKFSNRSLKFIERNSPKNEKVRTYIQLLAEKVFHLSNYDFIQSENDVIFKIQDCTLVLNEDYVELHLYKNKVKVQTFVGDSCWYQGLKFIKENFKI